MSATTEPLNVRVPSGFKQKLDAATEEEGFDSRSDLVRFALRSFLAGSDELTPDAAEKVRRASEQFESDETHSLAEVVDDLEIGDHEPQEQESGLITEQRNSGVRHTSENQEDTIDKHVAVIGCAGAGISIVNQLIESRAADAETFAFDSDKADLRQSKATTPVRIGEKELEKLSNLGNFEETSNRQDVEAIRQAVHSTISRDGDVPDHVFLATGLGGKTGTYLAPHLADILARNGTTVTVIGTLPFSVEAEKMRRARSGVNALNHAADTMLLLDGSDLTMDDRGVPYGPARTQMNQTIARLISQISTDIDNFRLTNEELSVESILTEGEIAVLVQNSCTVDDIGIDLEYLDSQYAPGEATPEDGRAAVLDISIGAGVDDSTVERIVGYINEHSDLDGIAWTVEEDQSLEENCIEWSGFVTGIESNPQEFIPDPQVSIDYEILEPRSSAEYPPAEMLVRDPGPVSEKLTRELFPEPFLDWLSQDTGMSSLSDITAARQLSGNRESSWESLFGTGETLDSVGFDPQK
ncbi:hypothetical protein [Haloarcula sp. CGMCC 1.2071]|uniref:hypothetical protein n=1 Tax=Haloarcula sp. CGMCC 1.2071 TaxID=3111454 RepID=UPI00300F4F08